MAGNAGRAPAPRGGLRRRRRGPRASAGAISANPSCYGTRHGRPCPGPDTASGPPEQGAGPAGGTRGEHSPKPRGYHAGGRLPATHSHAAPTRPWCCSQRERDRMSEQEGRGRGGRVPPVAHSPRVAHPEHQWGCGHCAPGSLSGSTGRVTPIPKGCRTGDEKPVGHWQRHNQRASTSAWLQARPPSKPRGPQGWAERGRRRCSRDAQGQSLAPAGARTSRRGVLRRAERIGSHDIDSGKGGAESGGAGGAGHDGGCASRGPPRRWWREGDVDGHYAVNGGGDV